MPPVLLLNSVDTVDSADGSKTVVDLWLISS